MLRSLPVTSRSNIPIRSLNGPALIATLVHAGANDIDDVRMNQRRVIAETKYIADSGRETK
jgi:hypothetical protein